MNEILTLVTFLALLFYTGIEMKFQLQMLQQNSYRNDRYNRWLKGESFASVSRLTDLFLLLLLSTNFLPTFVQIVTITVVLAKSVKGLQTKYKKPLVFTKRACNISIPIIKKMIPPTIRRLSMEIPKKRNNKSPEIAKNIMMRKETKEARRATFLRSFSSSSIVMVIKTGIAPNGLINVKNEVKQSNPNVNISILFYREEPYPSSSFSATR